MVTKETTYRKPCRYRGDWTGAGREAAKAGVRSTAALPKHGGKAKGRKELGIGSEYSDLLEAARVDTVPELKQGSAKALYDTLVKANEAKKLVRKMPTADQVAEGIKQAKSLPELIKY